MTIGRLLVANRGEIASRVIRTARAMGIDTVAVHSDPDTDAPFVHLADEAVHLPGISPGETYLRTRSVVRAAELTGCDAVHPGYGFLSEDAGFARACTDAGLIFVGPSPDVIEAMGSKVVARERMQDAGVPILPGAVVTDPRADQLAAAADAVGYPLLVKATFGGGGRGMRVVTDPAHLADAVASARREASSAFGDADVFLERYVRDPRHIEVQIVGDCHGTVVHLFERECSVQRRYQKIVEECPSPAVDDVLRGELGAVAVAAAKAIGYVGVGTVEFVLGADGAFHFLEVNTRIQVEHPVTELVTGLDLVELQIRVAEGEPLPSPVLDARIDGHAIEARLYAEDPGSGFLPTTGTLRTFHVEPAPGVRVDAGVTEGSVVGTHYDPMLAKLVAHGSTRREAARRLARSLARARIHGLVTNRDLLVGILRDEDFLAGHTDTGYLDRHRPAELCRPPDGLAQVPAVAAALARYAAGAATGLRYVSAAPHRIAFVVDGREISVGLSLGPAGAAADVDGEPLPGFRIHATAGDRVDLEVAGVRRSYVVASWGDTMYVDGPEGGFDLTIIPRFVERAAADPGSLLAPMPGSVVRVLEEVGSSVAVGRPLVLIEAMKMEHTVSAPADGVLAEVRVRPGQQVDTGDVLAVVSDLDAADGSSTG